MMTVSGIYRSLANRLAEKLLAELKDDIHSIILFGSVARGDATKESDIDVLIITDAAIDTKQRLREITYDMALDEGVLFQLVIVKAHDFRYAVTKYRSYFTSDIIAQGIQLFDDGTFRRICQAKLPVSTGISNRR